MIKINFVAPCLFGIEGILADELRRIGASDVNAQNGKVLFSGGPEMAARVNINSRYAERVQVLVGSFEAKSFEALFEGTKALPWEDWIGEQDRFPVKGWSIESELFSVSDCQSIIKKAVVERLKTKYSTDWFEETEALYQIQFAIHKNEVSLLIDTTGAGLHKRGYRAMAGAAPIKETIAAAIADLSRARFAQNIYDPCCGSGTLLIEAALSAMRIPPGANRVFSAMEWRQIPRSAWSSEKQAARDNILHDKSFTLHGSDIDKNALYVCENNAEKAGVRTHLKTHLAPLADFVPEGDEGLVLCNPPYGERLLGTAEAEEIYRTMGRVFVKKPGWKYFIISPHDDFEQLFGRPADKRRKLYNGMMKCQLFMYYK